MLPARFVDGVHRRQPTWRSRSSWGSASASALERAGFGSARKLTAVFYLLRHGGGEGDVHGDRHRDGRAVRAVRAPARWTCPSSTSSPPTSPRRRVRRARVRRRLHRSAATAPARRSPPSPPAARTGSRSRSACCPASGPTRSSRRASRLDQGQQPRRDDAALAHRRRDGLVGARVRRLPRLRRVGHEHARAAVRRPAAVSLVSRTGGFLLNCSAGTTAGDARTTKKARCIVAALADIRDIRFGPLRPAHRFRRLCVRRTPFCPCVLQRTSDSGH